MLAIEKPATALTMVTAPIGNWQWIALVAVLSGRTQVYRRRELSDTERQERILSLNLAKDNSGQQINFKRITDGLANTYLQMELLQVPSDVRGRPSRSCLDLQSGRLSNHDPNGAELLGRRRHRLLDVE